ncbi:hypothetical protein ACHMZP_09720 [Rhodococcus baikonurensis]|uniref:AMP-binding enzyme n=1 Tax=Rhodococcus baikonurensis TaxID=172041 RepID=UPI0037B1314C
MEVGSPHGSTEPLWGEAVKAVVVAAAGHQLDTDVISGFVRSRLAGYKCPKSIEIVTELPGRYGQDPQA